MSIITTAAKGCSHIGRDSIDVIAEHIAEQVSGAISPDAVDRLYVEFDESIRPGQCPACTVDETFTSVVGLWDLPERFVGGPYRIGEDDAVMAQAYARSSAERTTVELQDAAVESIQVIDYDQWPYSFIDWSLAAPQFMEQGIILDPSDPEKERKLVYFVDGFLFLKPEHRPYRPEGDLQF